MHSLPNLRLDSRVAAIPHVSQYAGAWAIEPDHLRLLVANASRLHGPEFAAHVAENQPKMEAMAASNGLSTSGAIGVIRVQGVMTKFGSSMSPEGSTVLARRAIRSAVMDDSIKSILLVFDSPGGTVAGTDDLAAEVLRAREAKPVWAYCEDLCCSAAYWVASQADKVFANRTATIGSIGAMMVVEDWSKAYENDGVKVHVVSTGELKGTGIEGSQVTEAQLAALQENISANFSAFGDGVRKERQFSKADFDAVSSGRTWVAPKALELRLIDGVQSFDKTLAALSKAKKPAAGKGNPMSEGTEMPAVATFKELVAACPGIDTAAAEDAMFLSDCQKRDLTATAANAEWCKTLKARSDAARAEATEAKKTPPKPPGVNAVNDAPNGGAGASDASDPIVAWEEAIDAALPKHGNSRAKATASVVRANPSLHRAYVNAKNETAGRAGRI